MTVALAPGCSSAMLGADGTLVLASSSGGLLNLSISSLFCTSSSLLLAVDDACSVMLSDSKGEELLSVQGPPKDLAVAVQVRNSDANAHAEQQTTVSVLQ